MKARLVPVRGPAAELDYVLSSLGSLTSSACFLGTAALLGIINTNAVDVDEYFENNANAAAFFYGSAAIAVGTCGSAAAIGTIILRSAPALAVRGPSGSLVRAVEGARKWQRFALGFLAVGVVALQLEGLTYAWMVTRRRAARGVATFVFLLLLCVLGAVAVAVAQSFTFDDTGGPPTFSTNPVGTVYRKLAGAPPPPSAAAAAGYGSDAPRRHRSHSRGSNQSDVAPSIEYGFTSEEEESEETGTPTTASVSRFFFGDEDADKSKAAALV